MFRLAHRGILLPVSLCAVGVMKLATDYYTTFSHFRSYSADLVSSRSVLVALAWGAYFLLLFPPTCQTFRNNSSDLSRIRRRIDDYLKPKLFEAIHQSHDYVTSEKLLFGGPGIATKPFPSFC